MTARGADLLSLDGPVALVTGASRGIGLDVAYAWVDPRIDHG